MIRQWILGLLVGTVAVAATSPLFVRSYVPRVWEPARQAWVYQPTAAMRWRREGYATTRFGPLGMPGKPSVAIEPDGVTWALWGDSQAEGLCVGDRDKLGNTLKRVARDTIEVLPFARSGDDCNDWIAQIAAFEKGNRGLTLPTATGEATVDVSGHLFLVTELSDWAQPVTGRDPAPTPLVNTVAGRVPAFLIHAARQIVTDGQTMRPRPLRFRIGPVDEQEGAGAEAGATTDAERLIRRQLQRLREQTRRHCVFVFAPPWPAVIDGAIAVSPADARLFDVFDQTCVELRFDTVDLRSTFAASVRHGDWPTGFHNGQYGQGHLNALGNRLIAREVWTLLETFQRSD